MRQTTCFIAHIHNQMIKNIKGLINPTSLNLQYIPEEKVVPMQMGLQSDKRTINPIKISKKNIERQI